jgi:signal transduction histidine kinase
VAESVRDVTDALNAMASMKDVTFRISSEGPTNTSWKVAGDHARLERILFNLLENALRHTRDGTMIVVRLRDEGSQIRVSIKDRGQGVPDSMKSSLFEKFSQGSTNSGKVGLGLYFCRITVEGWGGEIGCLPNMKDGACFWFTLPKAGQNGVGH